MVNDQLLILFDSISYALLSIKMFITLMLEHEFNFSGGSGDHIGGEMHLLPDPLFSIPTDGVYITNIVGADNGRIFMAGKDGCLYELIYQVCIMLFIVFLQMSCLDSYFKCFIRLYIHLASLAIV